MEGVGVKKSLYTSADRCDTMGFTMTAEEIIKFLEQNGFCKVGTGRHLIMTDGRRKVPIPVHSGNIPKGTVRSILRLAGYSGKQAKEWKERG